MAEEKKGERDHKAKKKHLHQIRSEEAEDGNIVHHHTYKGKRGDTDTEPERRNVAVSTGPEEAGQHIADQFAMNQPPAGGQEPGGEEPGGEAAPQEMMG
jgi:hypothetical protein